MFFSLLFSGILFGSGPCLLSCGPVVLPVVAAAKGQWKRSCAMYFLFSAARFSAYIIVGISIYLVGQSMAGYALEQARQVIALCAAAVLITMGVCICMRKTACTGNCGKGGVVLSGFLIGLLPCAPLWAVLGYSSLISKSIGQCIVQIAAFGVGTIISPLLFASVFLGKAAAISAAYRWPRMAIRWMSGITLVVFGVYLGYSRL